jgi:acyl-CoA hydrolase
VGAQISEGGKSIIALYSSVKNDTISTIVPTLTPGAPVTLSRMDVDYVVTEQGVAALRGRSIRDRVKSLIAIAHPKFRDELREQVAQLGIC